MTDEAIIEAVQVLNPRTLARARRLTLAIGFLRRGHSRGHAILLLRERCNIGRLEAWRLVTMAADLAGKIEEGDAK